MTDRYSRHHIDLGSPLIGGFAITPNDDVDLIHTTRQIRITGASGNLAVVWYDGTETTEPVITNTVLDWRVTRIRSANTTATGIRGYY
jgi:hypothetical protein